MIVDQLENAGNYVDAIPGLADALSYIGKIDTNPPEGRVELPELNGYALVLAYDTEQATMRKLETHQRFVDLQVVLSGREAVQWAWRESLAPREAYDPDSDVAFWQDGPMSEFILEAGQFAVFLPWDAHKPGCLADSGASERIKKLVIKIPVSDAFV